MTWAAPLWLFALLPWSAVVAYLLWGRRPRVDVPFLELWPARDEGIRVRRRATPPPVALAMAILATLLALLAAGRPAVSGPRDGSLVSVIIDCGWTMSSIGANNPAPAPPGNVYHDALQSLGSRPLNVWTVPAGANEPFIVNASNLLAGPPFDRCPPTAVDTRDALRATVRDRLAEDNDTPVIVFSNQPLGIDDDRIVQIAPPSPAYDAAIMQLSARDAAAGQGPPPQVMALLRAAPGLTTARLRMTTGDETREREITFPPEGGERDAFVDFTRFGPTIKAELLIAGDGQLANNTAWLVRESSWPRIEARAPLPPYVQRMVDVFTRRRPPTDSSKRVVITSTAESLPVGEAGVVIATTTATEPAAARGPVETARRSEVADNTFERPEVPGNTFERPDVADHPVARDVNWADVASPALARTVPGPGWSAVVSAGGKTWVAVREQPTRAVWIGFDSIEWARTSDFVVFWADVFNWAGGGAGAEHFASHAVESLEGNWTPVDRAASPASPPPQEPRLWPGLYRRDADGTLRALHAPDRPTPQPFDTYWRQRLARLPATQPGRLNLTPLLAALAVMCLAIAALTWKKRPASHLDRFFGRP